MFSLFPTCTVVSIGFGRTSYTVSEGDCFITVDVRLNGLAAIPLTINLSTTSDVAIAGQDFVRVSMTPLTINPGTVLSQANIQLIDDHEVEMAVESFMVMLEPRSEGVLRNIVATNNRTTVYIQDDDTSQAESKFRGYGSVVGPYLLPHYSLCYEILEFT